MQVWVYVAKLTGRLLDCNDAFIRMLGYSGCGKNCFALNLDSDICVDSNQRDEFRRKIDLQNYVRNFDVTLRRKDGTLLLAEESSFATRNQAGKIDRYQGFVLDMTEKRRAEDEMRRRNRELNALNAMAVVATQSFDLDEILNLTLRQVVSLFGAESGSVYLSDSDAFPTYRRRAMGSTQPPRSLSQFLSGGGSATLPASRTEVITLSIGLTSPAGRTHPLRQQRFLIGLFWGGGITRSASWDCAAIWDTNIPATKKTCWSRSAANWRRPSKRCGSYEETCCKPCGRPDVMQEQLPQSRKMARRAVDRRGWRMS